MKKVILMTLVSVFAAGSACAVSSQTPVVVTPAAAAATATATAAVIKTTN